MYILNLKALGFVLLASLPTFWLMRRVMIQEMGADAFAFRRNIWIACTVLVFASPSYWIFTLTYIVLISAVRKRENNPVGLFLLLMYVAPAQGVELPSIGSIALISIDNFIVLTVFLLLPALLKQRVRQGESKSDTGINLLPWVILFCAIQVVLWTPDESPTHSMRRSVSFVLSTIVLYLGFARLLVTRAQLMDALSCMLMGLTLMASVAIMEAFKGWLLYRQIGTFWSPFGLSAYVMREGALRVSAATDTPLVLGLLCVNALALAALTFDRLDKSRRVVIVSMAVISCVALYAARSRAPWICALFCAVVYLAFTPRAMSRLALFAVFGTIGGVLVLLSPLGDKVIDFLPYVGTVDSANVSYREAMNDALRGLTLKSPWTGNRNFLRELESLRQGQGIIDLLNVYLVFGAAFGLPGMLSFIACLLLGIRQLLVNIKQARISNDTEKQVLNANILAMLIALAIFMFTASYVPTVATTLWVLLGLATSRGARESQPMPAQYRPRRVG